MHKNGDPAKWDLGDGFFTVKPGTGDILSREVFGSCQLHVEFRSPSKIEGDGQDRGNSGVYFMENYEVGDTGYKYKFLILMIIGHIPMDRQVVFTNNIVP